VLKGLYLGDEQNFKKFDEQIAVAVAAHHTLCRFDWPGYRGQLAVQRNNVTHTLLAGPFSYA
jgi:hypothetical protein